VKGKRFSNRHLKKSKRKRKVEEDRVKIKTGRETIGFEFIPILPQRGRQKRKETKRRGNTHLLSR